MRITCTERDDWTVVTLSDGEDSDSGTAFAQLAGGAPRDVRIDLQVTVVDAAVLAVVDAARALSRHAGKRFHMTAPGDLVLLADDVPPERWSTQDGDCRAVLFGTATDAALRAGLSPPCRGFLEACAEGLGAVGRRCLASIRAGGVALSLSTAAIYHLDAANIFAESIRRRGWCAEEPDMLALCLAEAVGNAVVHGNLGIAGGLRSSRQGYELFRTLMNERMADATRAARRVEISLHPGPHSFQIAVADQGDGFDFRAQLAREEKSKMQGRGLSLMHRAAQHVWSEDDGRVMVMDFSNPV